MEGELLFVPDHSALIPSKLVRGYLPEEYVAHLLARHVEVHQELLAARRDFHAVEERTLVRAALGEATEVDHHAVAARQLLGAHGGGRLRCGLRVEALAVERK